jgi:hypothetical protein
MYRSNAWFDRQLAHVQAILADLDRVRSPDELRMAEMALADDPGARQKGLWGVANDLRQD